MTRGAGGAARLLADLARLAKLRISLLSTLSAAAGFAAARGACRPALAATLAGTFLLAAAAAALNEVADRDRDARMERTRDRPIPAKRIGAATAAALALLAGAAGAGLLWRGAGPAPALLGVGALLWYDAVYTPLKRATAFAVLPGALVGAVTPAIGFTAAGGALSDARLHALAAFFVAWQVPHFWLLSLRHGEDYARGGFPTPSARFAPAGVARITLAWTLAMAGCALLLPIFGVTRTPWAVGALAAAAALAVPPALGLLRRPGDGARIAAALAATNWLAVALLAIVVADAIGSR